MTSESAERLPVEQWAKQKLIPAWKFVVAKAHEQWPVGLQVTEAEFEAAVDAACHAPLR